MDNTKKPGNPTTLGTYSVVKGDATSPENVENNIVIPHVCNDQGGWGSGFVLAINRRYGYLPRAMYLNWKEKQCCSIPMRVYESGEFALGEVQMVIVKDFDGCPSDKPKKCFIANMIGQHLTGEDEHGNAPIRYAALVNAMDKVTSYIHKMWEGGLGAEIVCPKFGSGLAGGDWNFIEVLIKEIWCGAGINVTVCEYED